MAEQAQKRSADRSIVHCLLCHKPQENLPVHLTRVCMKNSTAEERADELAKAKASGRAWIRKNRAWNYNQLCEILPDRCSRIAMVKELLRRGFFITDLPQESELVLEAERDSPSAAAPSPTQEADHPSDRTQKRFVDGAPGIKDCQTILRVAKPDFLRIHGDLLKRKELSNTEKTLYRYYCEALLVFRHMQRPGTVEALTDADWVERITEGGRVVICVQKHKASSMGIALTKEEEACLQLYYRQIRPENIGLEKFCQSFFVSSSREAVHSVSQDMNRLHEMYKLAPFTSQDVRRAVGTAAQKLPAQQQEAVNQYTHSAGAVRPRDVVDAAELLDSLAGTSSDDDTSLAELGTAGTSSRKDFSAFVTRFPVSLEGQPPTKRQRVDSGFPADRVFYDKWRTSQYAQREEYLLSRFTLRKPSAVKVARLITQEGWKANYPKPEEIERLWKPAPKRTIETDEVIIRCVSEQTWTGLAIKDFGAEQGLGVVATRRFSKGDIVCDYHGKVIPAAEGRAMMQNIHDEAGYVFFFKAGQRDLCIDAQTFPCECHPDANTVGRRINHSSKRPNLKPFHCVLKVNGEDKDVILFKALQDITVDTQFKFDYGSAVTETPAAHHLFVLERERSLTSPAEISSTNCFICSTNHSIHTDSLSLICDFFFVAATNNQTSAAHSEEEEEVLAFVPPFNNWRQYVP
ncbi:uncharacterized protein LOC127507920 isoform X2 [Ctenopharyngodon idella]|nr:uncharacterized protein LOC127507918 isoform X2 [Ctenopharyngodon idella]XP_051741319.1 uncharacterized protein LOC127507920 isoform X1 [Ctenopharyngodon idella]XP_051741320.1 uncharacterized protein LOC127507920 isoform X2 [Ctenopharyngodon idella]